MLFLPETADADARRPEEPGSAVSRRIAQLRQMSFVLSTSCIVPRAGDWPASAAGKNSGKTRTSISIVQTATSRKALSLNVSGRS
jgi:hypothetical protein